MNSFFRFDRRFSPFLPSFPSLLPRIILSLELYLVLNKPFHIPQLCLSIELRPLCPSLLILKRPQVFDCFHHLFRILLCGCLSRVQKFFNRFFDISLPGFSLCIAGSTLASFHLVSENPNAFLRSWALISEALRARYSSDSLGDWSGSVGASGFLLEGRPGDTRDAALDLACSARIL